MIYSNFGCKLTIVADLGTHRFGRYKRFGARIVRAIREDDNATRHYITAYLRADGGINAIEEAADAATKVQPTKTELPAIFAECE